MATAQEKRSRIQDRGARNRENIKERRMETETDAAVPIQKYSPQTMPGNKWTQEQLSSRPDSENQ